MPEVLTRVDPDDSIERSSGLHHPCRDCDRERLEREVIEAAKKWLTDAPFMSDTALADRIQALIDFESQIKK